MSKKFKKRVGVSALLLAALLHQAVVWAEGKDLFTTQCSSCHSLHENSKPTVGPPLFNIVDRPAATIESYEYSDAMTTFGAAGNRWDRSTLMQFLQSPQALVSGTKMGYQGMASGSDREALIDQLASPEDHVQTDTQSGTAIDPEVERIAALNADTEYGNYLASECLTCHAGSGSDDGIPVINGLPKTYLIQALLDYKNGIRDNSVMKLMAGNLGDDELSALAEFFTNQEP